MRCANCNTPLIGLRGNARYCTEKCRREASLARYEGVVAFREEWADWLRYRPRYRRWNAQRHRERSS